MSTFLPFVSFRFLVVGGDGTFHELINAILVLPLTKKLSQATKGAKDDDLRKKTLDGMRLELMPSDTPIGIIATGWKSSFMPTKCLACLFGCLSFLCMADMRVG